MLGAFEGLEKVTQSHLYNTKGSSSTVEIELYSNQNDDSAIAVKSVGSKSCRRVVKRVFLGGAKNPEICCSGVCLRFLALCC